MLLQKQFGKDYGVNIDPQSCPKQWGAWRSYFKAIGKPVGFMDARGEEFGKMTSRQRETLGCFDVPAPFPSDFDSDWDPAAEKRQAGHAKPVQSDMTHGLSLVG